MSKFVTGNGEVTTSDDTKRTIWYGKCGYWTDDWDKTTLVGPVIPACPRCKTPGYICVASDWFDSAKVFDNEEPGYLKFLDEHKEKCYRHYPNGLITVWWMMKDIPESPT